MIFYLGIHIIAHAWRFENTFISINVLKNRKKDIKPNNWILDSGAFTNVLKKGEHELTVKEYKDQIERWKNCGNLKMAVTQDYMCEDIILKKWNYTVNEQQEKTLKRFYQLIKLKPSIYIMPVIQGYTTQEYLNHLNMYEETIYNQVVGIGSICKRNRKPDEIYKILKTIKDYRPDLKLHAFGLKITSLKNKNIRDLLYSADSMAWSFEGRKIDGYSANDPFFAIYWNNELLKQIQD
jgi:hypothetical protein